MKEFAAAQAHAVFQRGDDLFESLCGDRRAVEQEKREMTEHVAGSVAREDGVSFDFGEDFWRVVVKDNLQQVGERAAVLNLRAENRGGAFAPGELRRRDVDDEPAFFAQNFGYVAGCESARGSDGRGIRNFWRSHQRNSSAG